MLAKRIIPCLDVKDGRVVKGVNFVNLRDAGDPVELAAIYDREGADELVFLDISASVEGRATMVEVVRKKTAGEITIPFTVGGGISSVEDMKRMLRAGADKIGVNTAAVKKTPSLSRAERPSSARSALSLPSTPNTMKLGESGRYLPTEPQQIRDQGLGMGPRSGAARRGGIAPYEHGRGRNQGWIRPEADQGDFGSRRHSCYRVRRSGHRGTFFTMYLRKGKQTRGSRLPFFIIKN